MEKIWVLIDPVGGCQLQQKHGSRAGRGPRPIKTQNSQARVLS